MRINKSSLVCSFFVMLSACYRGERLNVQYAAPTGAIATSPQWLEIELDRPVINPDEVNPQAAHLEITIDPPIAGELRFPTPSTLHYSFAQAPMVAQDYEITLEAGLRSFDQKAVLKRDYTFHFTTEVNGIANVERVVAGDVADSSANIPERGDGRVNNLALDDRLLIHLRYPERVQNLKSLLTVRGTPMSGGPTQALEFKTRVPQSEVADRLLIEPATSWPAHTTIVIGFKMGLGISGVTAGPLRTKEEEKRTVQTYGPMEITAGPVCLGCVPPKTLLFEFATLVSCEKAKPFIEVSGVKELICTSGPSPATVRLEPLPGLRSRTTYSVTVKPGIPDEFGQTLERGATYTITTGDSTPRFAHQLMFNILEANQSLQHVEKVFEANAILVEGSRLPFTQAWNIIAQSGLRDQVAWRELPWWLSDEYGSYYMGDCEWDEEQGREICSDETARRLPGTLDNFTSPLPHQEKQTVMLAPTKGWQNVEFPLAPFLKEQQRGLLVLKNTALDNTGQPLGSPVLRLLNITDLGLSARYSPSQLVVLVARLSDGKPVKGAEVKVYGADPTDSSKLREQPLGTTTTDDSGLAVFSAAQLLQMGQESNLQAHGLFVVANLQDDEAFMWSKFESGGRRAYSSQRELLGTVYTERGVYRPGESVHFRAVLRKAVEGGLATPSGKVAVRAVRSDAGAYYDGESADDSQTIWQSELELSSFGTVSGDFKIPSDAAISDYELRVDLAGEQLRHAGTFKVAEFRRAEMKVVVQPEQLDYVVGDTLHTRINADYLFGAPASGQKLRWTLRRSAGEFRSKRVHAADFSDDSYFSWREERDNYSSFLDEGTATLDDKGSFVISRQLNESGTRGKMESLIISGTVEDANGQSVSHTATVNVHPAAFHVGFLRRGYLKEKGKTLTFEVVGLSNADELVSGQAIEVVAEQEIWESVKRLGPGGGYYWTYNQRALPTKTVCKGATDDRGLLACQFIPQHGGSLKLVARAQDNKGRTVQASTWYWITGDEEFYGARSDSENSVTVMPESYDVESGDKVRVAINTPFRQALALVTVEREDILWRKVLPVGSNSVVEIQVDPSWVPNVYISASVVRGRVQPEGELQADPERDKPAYALGYAKLAVKPTRHLLDVKLSTDVVKLEPGQKLTATVQTLTKQGRAVPSEVNLYAVDEGVLILTGYQVPQLTSSLFVERPFSVLALDTRMHVLGERKFLTPAVKGEESGGGGGLVSDDQLRKDFNPVATWVGSLVTDSQGKATHTFKVPDTVTTYRLMAVAVGSQNTFGSAQSEFKVQKTLMMRQAMPRFLRPGDIAQAGVVVNHLTGESQQVTVSLETIDEKLFSLRTKRSQTLAVGAKETTAFRFELTAADVEGASEIIFAASTKTAKGEFRDKVQLTLPVKRLQPRQAISVSGILDPGQVTHALNMPAEARPVSFDINASGLPVASLEERMRLLVEYPYGCLEQRTSRIMPLIAVRELGQKLGFTRIPYERIDQWVQEWINMVPKFACGDGGFDYYPGCKSGSDAYLTAFALDGLSLAQRYNYKVPQELLVRPLNYLEDRLASLSQNGSSWDQNTSGMAGPLRILTKLGKSKPEVVHALYEGRANLPLFSKIDLLRAMFATKKQTSKEVQTLLDEVMSRGVTKQGAIRFAADSPHNYWWAWDSDLRNTAIALQGLVEVAPDDARIPLIARGLIQLDGEARAYPTQGVTQTLLALAEVADKLKSHGDLQISAKLGERVLWKNEPLNTKVLTQSVPATELKAKTLGLQLENHGRDPLYFGAFLRFSYPATVRLPGLSQGFSVQRTYTRRGTGAGEAIRVGDFVMVQLVIEPSNDNVRMVVVDDPLPAGLEPVDTSLATSEKEMHEVMSNRQSDWTWWQSRYNEIHDDHVEWHFREMYASKRWPLKLQYLTRARTAGTFHAPGTFVERMYQPDVFGRSPSTDLTVLP